MKKILTFRTDKLAKYLIILNILKELKINYGHLTVVCLKTNYKFDYNNMLDFNGDTVEIINSKNVSPSLHWISLSKTGKARAAIRRYWQDRSEDQTSKKGKKYTSTLLIDLPDQPGVLGEVSTLIGLNGSNILNVELVKKKDKFLQFSFDLQINDLKNFTNLISQIKQKKLIFKIIRHKEKKNAFIQRFFKNFKRD